MPHAMENSAQEKAAAEKRAAEGADLDDDGENDAIQKFLNGGDDFGDGNYEFDQGEKADDAIDYEDISDDDDLPEEEEATNPFEDDEDTQGFVKKLSDGLNGLPGRPPSAHTSGANAGQDANAEAEADLFGESDDALFGEHSSSPEQHRAQPVAPSTGFQGPGGLALPSKHLSLALPGPNTGISAHRPDRYAGEESASPVSQGESGGYSPAMSPEDEDEEDQDPQVRMQRQLFGMSQRRVAGETVDVARDFDLDVFYSIYPRYEEHRNPNIIDLFPQRRVEYRGKVPIKPPKALPLSKLSLDLLLDQERSFKATAVASKQDLDASKPGLILLKRDASTQDESDDDLAWSEIDGNERVGGVTANDLAMLCEDWDILESDDAHADGSWEAAEHARPHKRQRTDILDTDFFLSLQHAHLSFGEPERATARIAKSVTLDMNDPNLLINEVDPSTLKRAKIQEPGRAVSTTKDLVKRYNISNDEAYDLLKENHQHKVRSTLGSMAVEHSLPATKLQFPFYRVGLDTATKRSFHRPHLNVRDGRNRRYLVQKQKHIKRKNVRGREIKDLFHKAEDLYLGDNASILLLEYSEEAPMMLSNFGMGNRLINYYRKRSADDQERPKRDIGETQVLLMQDKSPFANFGHVDQGEVVPTIQNGLFRAPVFEHEANPRDFLVGMSTTYENGNRFYLRNIENLHAVGQQFPLSEVPTEHSRKVTDASKKRLRAISYRIHTKAVDSTRPGKIKPLNNENIMLHLPNHDMPQTRSKMREFMKYERAPGKDGAGIWVPHPGAIVPDAETLRSWIKPEDVCLLESMQVGVQRLTDLGLYSNSKEADEEKDVEDSANIEVKLAPWQATKNFLNACQGKAMLKLHGEGDPTRRGEGFDFVKTSMKGGFQALGESAQDKLDAKKRKETGGHSYNVAKQQKAYDSSIRWIWDKQKQSLSTGMDLSDEDADEEAESGHRETPYASVPTPRSRLNTPSVLGRTDDESASQFSRNSTDRGDKIMVITRYKRDGRGDLVPAYETITDSRIIKAYKKKAMEKKLQELSALDLNPTGDPEEDEYRRQQIQKEINRISKNAERRVAREKLKGKGRGSTPALGAAATNGDNGDASGSIGGTPQKSGRGRNKDGTGRKCANCGQVGHIKTNRKFVTPPSFDCAFCGSQTFVPLATMAHGRGGDLQLSRPSSLLPQQRGGVGRGDSRAVSADTSTTAAHLRNDYSVFRL